METSVFLAQFWGWLLVILCLIYLLRGKMLLDEILRLAENRVFVVLGGYLAMILGLVTILLYNVWTTDWRVVITIFGWLSLLKGVTLMGCPQMITRTTSMLKRNMLLTQFCLVIGALLGAWLVWMTFV